MIARKQTELMMSLEKLRSRHKRPIGFNHNLNQKKRHEFQPIILLITNNYCI